MKFDKPIAPQLCKYEKENVGCFLTINIPLKRVLQFSNSRERTIKLIINPDEIQYLDYAEALEYISQLDKTEFIFFSDQGDTSKL